MPEPSQCCQDRLPHRHHRRNFEGKDAAGRAVRQLASALGEEGFRVVTGVGYQDARRLARIYHNESSLLISVDGLEANGQWAALEDLLTVTRRRNTRLPIFLLGDERNVESVPTRSPEVHAGVLPPARGVPDTSRAPSDDRHACTWITCCLRCSGR